MLLGQLIARRAERLARRKGPPSSVSSERPLWRVAKPRPGLPEDLGL